MPVENKNDVPLPSSVRSWLDRNTHPGLELDKYAATLLPANAFGKWQELVQKPTAERVARLSQAPPLELDWSGLRTRWSMTLRAHGAETFPCSTIGPLTLHLARASALENAGICLHPLYGFTYLPGSGLKGMARAYAETAWFPAQTDKQQAWRQVEKVFGWAPGSDKGKSWKPKDVPERDKDDNARVGGIVFHDAWPERWPQLIVDIVNNHHPAYYQAKSADDDPPGDWENPVPIYFLAVKPGTTFTFALSKRRADVADGLLAVARQWLLGALCRLGAGAKTAAGYGAFRPASAVETLPALPTTLELVSPAFLAGASQQVDDCDLRPATLRGHLRWWWRTMHAGFMDVKTLRSLEAAVWGDTNTGSAVRLVLGQGGASGIPQAPAPGKGIQQDRNGRDVLRPDSAFAQERGLVRPPDQKTTQGLLYLAFGMDEMPAGKPNERKRRQCILPSAKWSVALTARDGFYCQPKTKPNEKAGRISADLILGQAKAALWLLCQYGGVGSKGRNGFGSFADIEGYTLDGVKENAQMFRTACGIDEKRQSPPRTPALDDMLKPVQIDTPWKDCWFVLDQLGFSVQGFAKRYKRDCVKEALGLPRKIGASDKDGVRDRGYAREWDNQTRQDVVWLGQKHSYRASRKAKDMRHAAPVQCHLARRADESLAIRVVAFPSPHLPDFDTSRRVLKELLEHLENDFADRVRQTPRADPKPAVRPSTTSAPQRPVLPRSGDRVEAVLLEEKTKKGGWKAKHESSGLDGPIQNTGDVHGDKKPGDKVSLIVASATEREIAFRYPTAADEQRAQKPQGKPKGGGQRPRGRS